MIVTKHRRTGRFLFLIGTLAWAVACVSGGTDGGSNDGPECYASSDCSAGHECSKGVCIGYVGCGNGCRNNEDCLDGVCRLKCYGASDCEDEGLVCGTDTAHCKPGPNPTRSQSQTQSGTGGTGSTGAAGTSASHGGGGSGGASAVGGATNGGAPTIGAASAPSTAGVPGAGGAAAGAAGGPAGLAGTSAAGAPMGSFAGRAG